MRKVLLVASRDMGWRSEFCGDTVLEVEVQDGWIQGCRLYKETIIMKFTIWRLKALIGVKYRSEPRSEKCTRHLLSIVLADRRKHPLCIVSHQRLTPTGNVHGIAQSTLSLCEDSAQLKYHGRVNPGIGIAKHARSSARSNAVLHY